MRRLVFGTSAAVLGASALELYQYRPAHLLPSPEPLVKIDDESCREKARSVALKRSTEEDSMLQRIGRSVVISSVCSLSLFFLRVLNTVEERGRQDFLRLLENPPDDRPIITVSNHISTLDDPVWLSFIAPRSSYVFTEKMRWAVTFFFGLLFRVVASRSSLLAT